MAKRFNEFMKGMPKKLENPRTWVQWHLEHGDAPHDELMRDFLKKFGKDKEQLWYDLVNEFIN